jgi:hypothetical protein
MRLFAFSCCVLAATMIANACGRQQHGANSAAERVVFKHAAGRELTADDLKGHSGTVRWEVISLSTPTGRASWLVQQGIRQPKDRDVGANAERKRTCGCHRKHGTAPQQSPRVTKGSHPGRAIVR